MHNRIIVGEEYSISNMLFSIIDVVDYSISHTHRRLAVI
jgi:hypothetical protein